MYNIYMNCTQIIDPTNGNKYSIFEKNGKQLLKKYIVYFQNNGGAFFKKLAKKAKKKAKKKARKKSKKSNKKKISKKSEKSIKKGKKNRRASTKSN